MADTTVGSLIVKLLFETNAGEVLGSITGQAQTSNAAVDKLIGTQKGLTVVVNQGNEQLEKIVQTMDEKRSAAAGVQSALASVKESADKVSSTYLSTTEAGKEFAVTINRQKVELDGELGPLKANTEANDAHRQAVTDVARAKQSGASAASAAATTEAAASKKAASAYGDELGMIERLEIAKQDLIKARGLIPPGDLERIEAINAELRQTQRQLNELQGRGLKNVRQDFNDTAFQINRTHQVLFALSFLMNSMNSDHATEDQRKWQQSLTAGTTTAIGTSFALQSLGGDIAKIAGPAGIAIGALSAIVALLNQTDEAAKKASAEGLKVFAESIKGLSIPAKLELQIDVDKELAAVQRAIGIIAENAPKTVTVNAKTGQRTETPILTEEEKAQIERLQKRAELLTENKKQVADELLIEKAVSEQQQVTNSLVEDHRTRLQQIDTQLKIRNQDLQTGIDTATQERLTDEQIRDIKDEVAVLERQRVTLLQSTTERLTEQVSLSEQYFRSGEMSLSTFREQLTTVIAQTTDERVRLSLKEKLQSLETESLKILQEQHQTRVISSSQYVAELQTLLSTTTKAQQRLQIEQALVTVLNEQMTTSEKRLAIGDASFEEIQRELVAQFRLTDAKGNQLLTEQQVLSLREKLFTLIQSQADAETKLQTDLNRAHVVNITNLKEQQEAQEKIRHTERLLTIEKEMQAAIKAGVPADEVERARRTLIAEEDVTTIRNTRAIERRFIDELRDVRISNIRQEEDRIKAFYAEEENRVKRQLERGEISKELAEERLKHIQIERESAVGALQQKHLDEVAQSIDLIGNALHRAFEKSGGDLIQKMFAALQIAIQIAKTVQAMQMGATSGPLGALSIFGSLFGLLGFAEGGPVPSGSYVVNEQMSERYRPLLDALGAREVTGGVPHKDSVLAKTSSGAVALTPKERVLPPQFAAVGKMLNEGTLHEKEMHEIVRQIHEQKATEKVSVFERLAQAGAGNPMVIEMPTLMGGIMASKETRETLAMNREFVKVMALNSGGQVGGRYEDPTAMLRSGTTIQTIVNNSPGGVSAATDMNPVLGELRALRGETRSLQHELQDVIKNIEIKVPAGSVTVDFPEKVSVDVDNMQMRLRREQRALEKFTRRKKV